MSMLSADVIENKYPDLGKITQYEKKPEYFLVNATSNYTTQYEIEKAEFASSFACLIGIFQILIGICQFHRKDLKLITYQYFRADRHYSKSHQGFHFFFPRQ